jgi:DNA-binding beta-propeller fold protein YncE
MIAAPLLALIAVAPLLQEGDAKPAVADPYGRWLGTIGGLAQPSAVAVDDEGRVWIAEAFSDRVRAFDRDGQEVASIGRTGSGPGELLSPGGLAIAPDGTLYVADSGNHRIQRFSPEGEPLGTLGEWGPFLQELPPESERLNEPLGLAIAGERLYVADSRHHRIAVFTLDGALVASIGRRGREPGQLERPSAVAVDAEGSLYVADSGNHRVQKLDGQGRCVKAWGEFGPWLGFFSDPTGIAWREGRVYVADRDNHRVQVFSSDGELLYDFGVHALLPREGDGKVHYPDHLALAADGSFLALAESFEDRVQLFARWPAGEAPEPDPLRFELDQSSHYGGDVSVGAGMMALVEPSAPSLILWDLELDEPIQVCRHRWHGLGVGQLGQPVDAAIDPLRHLVHVADPVDHRIATYAWTPRGPDEPLRYDPFLLRLVRALDLGSLFGMDPVVGGKPGPWIEPDALMVAPDGHLVLADITDRRVWILRPDLELHRFVMTGDGGSVRRPVDMAADATGERVYVVDQLERRVIPFGRLGETTYVWERRNTIGGPEEERGGLVRPAGIEVLADGRIWVSDMARHRIVEYGPEGELRRTIGGPGLGRVQFHKPRGLAQDERGRVIVIDWGNHRGQILTDQGEYLDSFGARFFTRPARLQEDAGPVPPTPPRPPREGPAPAGEPGSKRPAAVPLPSGPWDDAERLASNGSGYLVLVRTDPSPVPENEEFAVTAWVFDPEAPGKPLGDVSLDVDAAMPEHGHGMNRVPEVRRRADGGFDAEGLLFHMGGHWELYLDVTRGAVTERAQRAVILE